MTGKARLSKSAWLRALFGGLWIWAAFLAPSVSLAGEWGTSCGPGGCYPGPSRSVVVPVQQPHAAVVRVTAQEHGGTSSGSGSYVARSERHGLVVTNWHVVQRATAKIWVQFPDGFRSAATVLEIDKTWDLAALLVWRPKEAVVPLRIRTDMPRAGECLAAHGYGSGRYRVASGRVVQYVAPAKPGCPAEMVEISVASRGGDSGGPILDTQGRLVAVLWGTAGGRTVGTYGGRVKRFLDGSKFKSSPSGAQGASSEAQKSDAIASLRLEIQAIAKQVIAIESQPGPVGPTGPRGPAGKPGAKVDLEVVLARLEALEAALRKPITVCRVKDGVVVQKEEVYLGGKLLLIFNPVVEEK